MTENLVLAYSLVVRLFFLKREMEFDRDILKLCAVQIIRHHTEFQGASEQSLNALTEAAGQCISQFKIIEIFSVN